MERCGDKLNHKEMYRCVENITEEGRRITNARNVT